MLMKTFVTKKLLFNLNFVVETLLVVGNLGALHSQPSTQN